MTTKRPTSAAEQQLSRELDRLMQQAASRPGIADLMALNERYQAKLAEIERSLGLGETVSFTTTNSTA